MAAQSGKLLIYNVWWNKNSTPITREYTCLRRGGRWRKSNGEWAGRGLFYHMKEFQKLLWPHKVWHKWSELELQCYLKYRIIGEIGPASSGKTFSAGTNTLADWYVWADCTTVMVSSTTRESLEMRVWGEIKKHHRLAKQLHPWLPGNLIEGRQRIVYDTKAEAVEGRDFRNGLVGIACKRGENFQGLGEYVGIKNKRVRLVADEGHFMPKGYVDSIANLNKNEDFKALVMGNPKETTDALGIICEPSSELGGWDGGIDQRPGTKTWPTRFPDGICIQLPGSDSPNLDGRLGIPLITQEAINVDIEFYGRDSLQFTMMNEGRMPRGQGSRRVITRQLCLKFGATEEPIWKNNLRTRIGALDAAYRGTGGDRCVFAELQLGESAEGPQIVALEEMLIVPVSVEKDDLPEDQIAVWVKEQCRNRGILPQNMFFDSTGRGTLMSSFARLWSPHVVPVEFGGPPSMRPVANGVDFTCRDYYSKFVSELWFSVRLAIESGQIRGMHEDLIHEGSMREWQMVGNNKIEVEPKDKMKLKTGRSPDLFDCFVTGIEGARRLGFVIQRLGGRHVRRGLNDEWKRELAERAKKLHHSRALNYSV